MESVQKDVFAMFRACGFSIKEEKHHDKIEYLAKIDLEARPDDFTVAFAFKDEHTEEEVRDLIMKWIDIRTNRKVDKVFLVLSGVEVLGEDRMMAKQHGIIVWEPDTVEYYIKKFHSDLESAKKQLKSYLGLTTYQDPDMKYEPEGAWG